MGSIQSNIGLITGIPITDTINSLLRIEARPRDLVDNRNKMMIAQRDAITDLTAKLLAFQFHVKKLTTPELFQQHSVTSSDTNVLGVRISSGTPVKGDYQFRPVQVARKQQLLSSTFASDKDPLGAGAFTFGYGGSMLSQGLGLDQLHGGQGISRGKIRITDRSGASAEIDLSAARTVNDVLQAVNGNSAINVTLVTDGARFRLIDNTGQTVSNLKVQELAGGTTAASLGLAGIDTAASSALGGQVFRLHGGTTLASLNDGLGVRFLNELADLRVTFRDGSTPLEIDFQQAAKSASFSSGSTTGVQGEASRLIFTAKAQGGALDGLRVSFVNDDSVTAGGETVEYDPEAKTLVVRIDEGSTTTDHIIAAIAGHSAANADLSVAKSNDLPASGVSTAVNGPTAQLSFTANSSSSALDGYTVSFVDDPGVTQGNETVVYNTNAKTIVFHIEAGVTTATDIVAAAAGNPELTADFTVSTPTNHATTTTAAANGIDAQARFTAFSGSADFNGVEIVFEDNLGISQGEETVAYIGGPPGGTLTFQIRAGETTANDIVAALEANPTVSALFGAVVPVGGDGTGLIDVSDTGLTGGGGNLGLIDVGDSASIEGLPGLIDVNDVAFLTGGAATTAKTELTLNDLLQTINEQGQGRLLAEISADGTRLQITDLTDNLGGSFTVSALHGSQALVDLGLDALAVGGTLTGKQLHSGLNSTLLRSLNGGAGLSLGALNITDRAGNTLSVDLSSAETLDDVLWAINSAAQAAGVSIVVGLNATGEGLLLTDTSGSATSNLIVASGDAAQTAEKLGLAVDAAVTQKVGGSLQRQSVTESTLLSALNGGQGVAAGRFQILTSSGTAFSITVNSGTKTIGDLIEKINGLNLGVEARVNQAGDGIELIDRAGGPGRLKVVAVGSDGTAQDLRLLGDSTDEVREGENVQVLRGTSRFTVTLDSDDTLDDLIEKINATGSGAIASKFGNGEPGNPFRILIVGARSGDAANLTFDTSGMNFSLQETVRAQDAVLSFGEGSGILVSSSSNEFESVIPGVEITVKAASATPVTVSVQATSANLSKTLTDLAAAYNTFRDTYAKYTFFNDTDKTSGVLFGTAEGLRLDLDLANVLTGRFAGNGAIQSFGAIGLSVGENGKLDFDANKLQNAFNSDPAAVAEFFTKETLGSGFKLNNTIESLVGLNGSVLVNRAFTLSTRIETNNERLAFFDLRLERKREQLEFMFYRLEESISKMRNSLSVLDQIQYIPPI